MVNLELKANAFNLSFKTPTILKVSTLIEVVSILNHRYYMGSIIKSNST